MPTHTCRSCRHWKGRVDGANDSIGMCSKPAHSSGFTGWQSTGPTDSCEDWAEQTYFRGSDGAMQVERRASARTNVDHPARLQTTGGDWSGMLTDISETGARLKVRNPPRAGMHALLRCGGNEIFCKVVWSIDDACGLAFDRPVSHRLVFEIVGRTGEKPQNVADLSKIPAGKKRGQFQPSGPAEMSTDAPDCEGTAREKVASLEERRSQPPSPAASTFESRDGRGYIKFYPFRAMANP